MGDTLREQIDAVLSETWLPNSTLLDRIMEVVTPIEAELRDMTFLHVHTRNALDNNEATCKLLEAERDALAERLAALRESAEWIAKKFPPTDDYVQLAAWAATAHQSAKHALRSEDAAT